MKLQFIETYKDGILGIIKIHGIDPNNYLNESVIMELFEAFQHWDQHDGVGVIVLCSSHEQIFSHGTDPNILQDNLAYKTFRTKLIRLCMAMEQSEKITVTLTHGMASGSAFELVLASDIRIATPQAAFFLHEQGNTLIPGAGGVQRLMRDIGKARTLDHVLTKSTISSEQAWQFGLISELVPLENLWEQLFILSNKLNDTGLEARLIMKKLVNEGIDVSLGTALRLEELMHNELYSLYEKNNQNEYLQK